MPRFTLSRRTFLRSACGAAVPLPALEIMGDRMAQGAVCETPKRFLMAWGGTSLSGTGVKPEDALIVPGTMGTGPNYTLSRGLSSIGGGAKFKVGTETYPSMKGDVGVVTKLKVPWNRTVNDPIPFPAGRTVAGFHLGNTWMVQLAGESNPKNLEDSGALPPKGSTADQIVADAIKGPTPIALLSFRVQASLYQGQGAAGNTAYGISYNKGRANTPKVSPHDAYNAIFGGSAANGKTINVAARLDRRKSILDTVLAKSKILNQRLGRGDQMRVARYYDEIRKIETSLQGLKERTGTLMCSPSDIPADPPIIDGFDTAAQTAGHDYPSDAVGWSNEELRAQLLCDFIHLAFSCDLTRVAALEFTIAQSQINVANMTESRLTTTIHGAGHGHGTLEDTADIVNWHVKHFTRLAAKLHDTIECDGTRVLDHCAMNMLWEGGHGDTGDPTRNPYDAHSTENIVCVVAGGAGGLKSGQRVDFKNNAHPAQILLTHMRAVGVPDSQPLGEVTQPLPELFSFSS